MLDLKKNVPAILLVGLAGAAVFLFLTGKVKFVGATAAAKEEAPPAEEERSHLVDGKIVLANCSHDVLSTADVGHYCFVRKIFARRNLF